MNHNDNYHYHYYNYCYCNHHRYYCNNRYCCYYRNFFNGYFYRISRQASDQSVNEDPTQHVHPYSHVTGVSISKAEAAKVGALYSILCCSPLKTFFYNKHPMAPISSPSDPSYFILFRCILFHYFLSHSLLIFITTRSSLIEYYLTLPYLTLLCLILSHLISLHLFSSYPV